MDSPNSGTHLGVAHPNVGLLIRLKRNNVLEQRIGMCGFQLGDLGWELVWERVGVVHVVEHCPNLREKVVVAPDGVL